MAAAQLDHLAGGIDIHIGLHSLEQDLAFAVADLVVSRFFFIFGAQDVVAGLKPVEQALAGTQAILAGAQARMTATLQLVLFIILRQGCVDLWKQCGAGLFRLGLLDVTGGFLGTDVGIVVVDVIEHLGKIVCLDRSAQSADAKH